MFEDETSAIRTAAIDALHFATAIYTAQPVVDDLLDRLNWPAAKTKLLDPSCGDGMFLARALERLLALGLDIDPCDLIEGWEIHPGACGEARVRVAEVLQKHGVDARFAIITATRMVHNKDFLVDGPTTLYGCVAGNPPYLRAAHVPAYLREIYSGVVPDYASADLLHSFLERCSRVVEPGGKIALVTADRWLTNASAARLREALGKRVSLAHVERLAVGSAFYRPKFRRKGSSPRIHPISIVLGADEGGRALSMEPIYPGVDETPYEGLPTLGEVAKVRLAPWLGTAGVFVVDAEVAKRLPPEVLIPAVDTDDFCDGKLQAPRRWAIRTRPDEEPCREVLDHLHRTMDTMAERGKQGKFWLPPEPFHQLDLSQESLLVPRIAKGPKAVRIPPDCLAINHNLSIVSAGKANLAEIESALASPLAHQWVKDHADRLENSYHSLTTTLLRKLPFVPR
ncbi:SAM-dependent methyltransferase [Burkholderia sp. Ac-20365]|nr:SAM-dependent methyltransferase [Burkholderia sp. Ac-20365]